MTRRLAAAAQRARRLRVSGDGRRLLDEANRPLFLNGEAGWSLFAQLSQAETTTYLADRQSKGFNAILASIVEYTFADNAPNNDANDAPFSGGDFQGMASQTDYWGHVDWVVEQATARGFYLLLCPAYIGFNGSGTTEGWYDEMASVGTSVLADYGTWVGERYREYPNIIWVNGGDANPENPSLVTSIANALKTASPDQLHTAHTAPDDTASGVWDAQSWLDIDNVYDYSDVYSPSETVWNNTPTRPHFMFESTYENEDSVAASVVRAQAYQSILAGGIGHFFGNCPVWSLGYNAGFCDDGTSYSASLQRQGSVSMDHFGQLFRSRDWWRLAPDFNNSFLTAGYGTSGKARDVAAVTAAGDLAIAYYDAQSALTFDLSQMAGTVRVWWYDPSDGSTTNGGTTAASAGTQLTPPSSGDWVLVLDLDSLGLGAPG